MEEDRQSNYERGITDEANMGFGQIVALCLLIQPILQLFDSITGTRVDTKSEAESSTDNGTGDRTNDKPDDRTDDRTDSRNGEDLPEDIV
ncbi:hypothetical protein B0T09DRAFT_344709 [Sordaria sp. MPI-SDFR-AT-0083]|nr:hypothetical protein B0T09DRAFT_344709 [Sordaria sp. MPI-SDFR-AT-0083]